MSNFFCFCAQRIFPAALLLIGLLVGIAGTPQICRADSTPPFVWGETTDVAQAGWGRMIHLKTGDWMCIDTLYPKPHSILQIEISSDGAHTWKPISEVAEAGRNLDNGELIQVPNGDLLLTGRSVVSRKTATSGLSYHLPVYRSSDLGKTWKFLSQIDANDPPVTQPRNPSVGLWEPHFFLLPDNRVACAYANEKHAVDHPAYSQVCSERISPDNGKSWGPEITLAAQTGGGGQRPGMPVVARMANGKYIAVFEVVGIGNADVYYKISPDGVSWPAGIGTNIPSQHAGPWVTSLQDGRLVVSSCANQISVSGDFGATWQMASSSPWPIGQVFSWPAIYQTGPNEIAAMITHNGVKIRWGRINPR